MNTDPHTFNVHVFNSNSDAPSLVYGAKTSCIGAIMMLRGFGFSDGAIDAAIKNAVLNADLGSGNSPDKRHFQISTVKQANQKTS